MGYIYCTRCGRRVLGGFPGDDAQPWMIPHLPGAASREAESTMASLRCFLAPLPVCCMYKYGYGPMGSLFDARSPAHLHEAPGPLAGAAAPAAPAAGEGRRGGRVLRCKSPQVPQCSKDGGHVFGNHVYHNGWESHAPPLPAFFFAQASQARPDFSFGPDPARRAREGKARRRFLPSSSSSLLFRPDQVLGESEGSCPVFRTVYDSSRLAGLFAFPPPPPNSWLHKYTRVVEEEEGTD